MKCTPKSHFFVRFIKGLVIVLSISGTVFAQDSSQDSLLQFAVSINPLPPAPRGVGFLLRWRQRAYLVTAASNADVSNKTTMITRRTEGSIVLKKRLDELTVSQEIDWQRLNGLHVCAAEIRSEEFGVAIADLVDLAMIAEAVEDRNESKENLFLYGFPLPNIEVFPAMTIPVSVVSDPLVYRLKGVEYRGALVYPSVGNCVGAAVVCKTDDRTNLRGLVVREIAFKDRISGFMLLIAVRDIAEGIAKLQ